MDELSLIEAVIAYYERHDEPFRYYVAGMLDSKADTNSNWANLRNAYVNGVFTPDDCRFMYSFEEK